MITFNQLKSSLFWQFVQQKAELRCMVMSNLLSKVMVNPIAPVQGVPGWLLSHNITNWTVEIARGIYTKDNSREEMSRESGAQESR